MATQGSGSIAHMGTLVSRRRQGGSLGYTAPSVSTGRARASTPDRRGLIAARWPPNGCRARKPNWTRCGPMASRGARADPRRGAGVVREEDQAGRQSPRVLHAVRSLRHRRPTVRVRSKIRTARRSPIRACSLTTPGRWAPTLPVPTGAVSAGIAFPRTPTPSHLASVRMRLRHPGGRPVHLARVLDDPEAGHVRPTQACRGTSNRTASA